MDGSMFRHLPIDALFSWPILTLICIGMLTVIGSVGFGLYWIISHLQWVW